MTVKGESFRMESINRWVAACHRADSLDLATPAERASKGTMTGGFSARTTFRQRVAWASALLAWMLPP